MKKLFLALIFTPFFSAYADSLVKVTSINGDDDYNLISITHLDNVIVASGSKGTLLKSVDAGATWKKIPAPAHTQQLQFRDIEYVAPNKIYALSIGVGNDSGLYVTANDGKDWNIMLRGKDEEFFNCVDFDEQGRGYLYGDPSEGHLFVKTLNQKGQWQALDQPIHAIGKEGGFASSGTCLQINKDQVVFVTGAGDKPRLFHKALSSSEFSSSSPPIEAGAQAGLFSSQIIGKNEFLVFSGDLQRNDAQDARAWHLANNKWTALSNPPITGAIYGSSYVKDKDKSLMVIVNPRGAAYSSDFGNTWHTINENDYWGVDCLRVDHCFAVGPKGRIDRFDFKSESR